jgi:hypothetical protein
LCLKSSEIKTLRSDGVHRRPAQSMQSGIPSPSVVIFGIPIDLTEHLMCAQATRLSDRLLKAVTESESKRGLDIVLEIVLKPVTINGLHD